MTNSSSSDVTQYRVTFFFGPEAIDDRPDHMRCVFNVKKRSWKGGVQVAVDVAQDHLRRARDRMDYQAWLGQLLQRVKPTDHEAVTRRADDLFIQAFCSCALTLALRIGVEQENQAIAAESFRVELDRIIDEQPAQLTQQIRLELDLDEAPHTGFPSETPVAKPEGV
ncbi:MAG: hypothetical protein K0S58_1758 [Nitrospira sp.]|nr:hypothetical protein [Nitrospira sp.]